MSGASCLIIDNNLVARILLYGKSDSDFSNLYGYIFSTSVGFHVVLAYGGELRREYLDNHKVKRILAQLDKDGRAKSFPDSDVDTEIANIKKINICISDDQHIMALAKISGVRILCSPDTDLQQDFKNKHILNPPGSIYLNKTHDHLLFTACK